MGLVRGTLPTLSDLPQVRHNPLGALLTLGTGKGGLLSNLHPKKQNWDSVLSCHSHQAGERFPGEFRKVAI